MTARTIACRLFLGLSGYILGYCLLSMNGRYVHGHRWEHSHYVCKNRWYLPGMPDDLHISNPYYIFFRLPWELDQRFIHATISQ